MGRFPIITILSLLLPGCAQLAQWPLFAPGAPAVARPAHYDFGWRLSGDRAVAPMQVFDDGRQMWLQFAANAPVPAIFSRSERGDSPLPYDRSGPYVVVQGVWPLLVLRGGRLQSLVERIADAPDDKPGHPADNKELPAAQAQSRAAAGPVQEPAAIAAKPLETGTTLETGTVAPSDNAQSAAQAALTAAQPAASAADTSRQAVVLPLSAYEVGPSDGNIRRALMRWADSAGWTFGAAHWTVDVDIPIVGSARFESGFKQAVQALLASTELAARPLQACFYSNKVLRVISYAQACDRTAHRTGQP